MNEIHCFYNSLQVERGQIRKFFTSKQDKNKPFKLLEEKIQRIIHFFKYHIWINKRTIVKTLTNHQIKDVSIISDFAETKIHRTVMKVVYGYNLKKPSVKEKVKGTVLFVKNFIINPTNTGSIIPSSKSLAKQIVAFLPKGFETTKKRSILEVGAGVGTFSDMIIAKLGPNDSLDIIEFNPEFADKLKEKYASLSSRVQVIQGDFLNYSPPLKYDYIISGLPLNSFSSEFVKSVFVKFDSLFAESGKLSYFEYSHINQIRMPFLNRVKKQNLKNIIALKKNYYEKYGYGMTTVRKNFPTARVLVHQKN